VLLKTRRQYACTTKDLLFKLKADLKQGEPEWSRAKFAACKRAEWEFLPGELSSGFEPNIHIPQTV